MTLVTNLKHVETGLARLIAQYKNQPNLTGFITPYLTQCQELETVAFQILSILSDVESQVGEQLDLVGRVVGQPRNGQTDTDYIKWILARMIVNRASGTPDELLQVLTQVNDNTHSYTEYYPASFLIRLFGVLLDDPEQIAAILTETRAAGVGGGLLYSTYGDDQTFIFADADLVQGSSKLGFSLNFKTPISVGYDPEPPEHVAVGFPDGTDSYIVRSTLPTGPWVDEANPGSVQLYGIAYSPPLDLYAAVGEFVDGTTTILTSPGTTGVWTRQTTTLANNRMRDIIWVEDLGKFIACGATGAGVTGGGVIHSVDGVTWIISATPKEVGLWGVAWSPAQARLIFVGSADGVDAYMLASDDGGLTFTEIANPKNVDLRCVEWSPPLGLFAAAGEDDGADVYLITSPTGLAPWTEQVTPAPVNRAGYRMIWSPSLAEFCLVGENALIMTSADAVTWVQQTAPILFQNHYGVTWSERDQSYMIATQGKIITSSDGTTFVANDTPSNIALHALPRVSYPVGGHWAGILPI